MKIKYTFVKRKIADDIFLVPVGEAAAKFGGLIMLNEISEFIYDLLPECDSADEIVRRLTGAYDVDAGTAARDVDAFLTQLRENGII